MLVFSDVISVTMADEGQANCAMLFVRLRCIMTSMNIDVKKRICFSLAVTVTALIVGCNVQDNDDRISPSELVEQISQNFESRLYQLPPRVQGHYGLRLYRMTGDQRYFNAVLYDYYVAVDRINAILARSDDRDYIAKQAEMLTSELSKGPRGRARQVSLRKYPEFLYYGETLRYAARLNEYGIAVPAAVTNAIANYDFHAVFTDKEMIRAWAGQLANYAHWLQQLNIVDYTQDYISAFSESYPDDGDGELSRWQYRNKLYGLTHLIIAASEYYQHPVSTKEFGWILKYFADHQSRILDSASADVIAEIAICFLLAGQSDHALVAEIKSRLLSQYSSEHSMILSVSGKTDAATGEHRNVLTLMLFKWPDQLTVGPCFRQFEDLSIHLPYSPYNWRSSNTRPSSSLCNS